MAFEGEPGATPRSARQHEPEGGAECHRNGPRHSAKAALRGTGEDQDELELRIARMAQLQKLPGEAEFPNGAVDIRIKGKGQTGGVLNAKSGQVRVQIEHFH